jgi:Alpha/beta hydrolase domain
LPTEQYSPTDFSQVSQSDLSPGALFSFATSSLQALSTGSINNASVRAAGLCLLSGYFLTFSNPTLSQLYPSHSTYVSSYTAAATAAEAAGFLTPADAAAAIAGAQKAPIP